MRKGILFQIFLLFTSIASAQTEVKNIETDIRGRNCTGGLGLCSIQPPAENDKTSSTPKSTIKLISLNEIEIQININQISTEEKKSISTDLTNYNLNKESISFIQDENLIIDEKTLSYIGTDIKNNIIKAGKYPLKIASTTISIIFTLTH